MVVMDLIVLLKSVLIQPLRLNLLPKNTMELLCGRARRESLDFLGQFWRRLFGLISVTWNLKI
jgi:hypothetical protein